jgi:hypothetical protein
MPYSIIVRHFLQLINERVVECTKIVLRGKRKRVGTHPINLLVEVRDLTLECRVGNASRMVSSHDDVLQECCVLFSTDASIISQTAADVNNFFQIFSTFFPVSCDLPLSSWLFSPTDKSIISHHAADVNNFFQIFSGLGESS